MRELIDAAKGGDLGKLEALLDGRDGSAAVDVNAVDSIYGSTSLMWAAEAGHVPCVGALLQKGADPRLLNTIGRTALHHAAANHRWEAVAVLLGAMDEATVGIKNEVGRIPSLCNRHLPHLPVLRPRRFSPSLALSGPAADRRVLCACRSDTALPHSLSTPPPPPDLSLCVSSPSTSSPITPHPLTNPPITGRPNRGRPGQRDSALGQADPGNGQDPAAG